MAKRKRERDPQEFNNKELATAIAGGTAVSEGAYQAKRFHAREASATRLSAHYTTLQGHRKEHSDALFRDASDYDETARWAEEEKARVKAGGKQQVHYLLGDKDYPMLENFDETARTNKFHATQARIEGAKQLKGAYAYEGKAARYAKAARHAKYGKAGSIAAIGAGTAAVGSAFYMRHRRNKLERVRKPTRSRTGM